MNGDLYNCSLTRAGGLCKGGVLDVVNSFRLRLGFFYLTETFLR